MDSNQLQELREQYIKNPPEGMTPELVRDMTDSDLLDMHYFMIEDDDLDDDEFEEGFYIFQQSVCFACPLPRAFLFSRVLRKENFPIK